MMNDFRHFPLEMHTLYCTLFLKMMEMCWQSVSNLLFINLVIGKCNPRLDTSPTQLLCAQLKKKTFKWSIFLNQYNTAKIKYIVKKTHDKSIFFCEFIKKRTYLDTIRCFVRNWTHNRKYLCRIFTKTCSWSIWMRFQNSLVMISVDETWWILGHLPKRGKELFCGSYLDAVQLIDDVYLYRTMSTSTSFISFKLKLNYIHHCFQAIEFQCSNL